MQVMSMMMAVVVHNLATPLKSNGGCKEVDEDGNGNGTDVNLNARINMVRSVPRRVDRTVQINEPPYLSKELKMGGRAEASEGKRKAPTQGTCRKQYANSKRVLELWTASCATHVGEGRTHVGHREITGPRPKVAEMAES